MYLEEEAALIVDELKRAGATKENFRDNKAEAIAPAFEYLSNDEERLYQVLREVERQMGVKADYEEDMSMVESVVVKEVSDNRQKDKLKHLTYAKTYVIIQLITGRSDNMPAVNITKARENIYQLVSDVNTNCEPVTITNNKGKNAVLIGESDWKAIEETLYLMNIPGMAESIMEGGNASLDECVSEDEVEW